MMLMRVICFVQSPRQQQQADVVPKLRSQTLDSLFANMKEQRMRILYKKLMLLSHVMEVALEYHKRLSGQLTQTSVPVRMDILVEGQVPMLMYICYTYITHPS